MRYFAIWTTRNTFVFVKRMRVASSFTRLMRKRRVRYSGSSEIGHGIMCNSWRGCIYRRTYGFLVTWIMCKYGSQYHARLQNTLRFCFCHCPSGRLDFSTPSSTAGPQLQNISVPCCCPSGRLDFRPLAVLFCDSAVLKHL
ncbi:hypothetical protein M378DRAFT_251570 [Amanita muscaria Koide BX008]|uniref:Uncharacterized protein n=1 Tax=Amanita muscaria (strain Koide BX008) TaxID=946122 RepID=A0A0C2XQA2_AMAMK|nr:hypothetical protein M378DRAFT_251570 [Amanita muscaria Koide BX008]